MTVASIQGRVLGSLNLPVQISSYQGLSWSHDNQLAIVTKKGVYVYEIIPSPINNINSLNFAKTFVENEEGNTSWQLESVLSEEELSKMDREHRSMIIMDGILSPQLEKTDKQQPNKVLIPPNSDPSKVQIYIYIQQSTVKLYETSWCRWVGLQNSSRKTRV